MDNDDKFILSKAHAGVALYAVLASKKMINFELLNNYAMDKSALGIHPEKELLPQIEFSSGSTWTWIIFFFRTSFRFKKNEKK